MINENKCDVDDNNKSNKSKNMFKNKKYETLENINY